MTLRELVAQTSGDLRGCGIESYVRDARALCAFALGIQPDQVSINANMGVTAPQQEVLLSLIKKRCERMPISRIIGSRLFWGRIFEINKYVLDPRGDTETLIALALEKPAKKILDLGTGTGNLAITLLCEWPEAYAIATDISSDALNVAKRNADSHKVTERLDFKESDWFENISSKFDLIVSNPPYISSDEIDELERDVKDYDPLIALSPGKDGLLAYRKIGRDAFSCLEVNGRLILEIGIFQGPEVTQILELFDFKQIETHKDLEGRDRVVSCIR
jgi:release factor glutamine methyltransferase